MADANTDNITRRRFIGYGLGGAAFGGLAIAGGYAVSKSRDGAAASRESDVPESYRYDVSRLLEVDPALLRYEQTEVLGDSFRLARDFAVGPEQTYLVAMDDALLVLSPAGKVRKMVQLDADPQCVGVDADGRIYLGMVDHVQVFAADYSRLAAWPKIDGSPHLTSIACLGGEVFVADAGNRVVRHYMRDGDFVGVIGQRDLDAGEAGFVLPSPYFDVAVDPRDRLWVANPGRHRLERRRRDGQVEEVWGIATMAIEGFCGCCNPSHFAILPDGRFVTCEKGLPRVKLYSPEGRFEGVVAEPDAFVSEIAAGWQKTAEDRTSAPICGLLPDDRIAVLYPPTGQLKLFSPRSSHA